MNTGNGAYGGREWTVRAVPMRPQQDPARLWLAFPGDIAGISTGDLTASVGARHYRHSRIRKTSQCEPFIRGIPVYKLSRTVPVNEPSKSFLNRREVWSGLLMKANNALPYVPIMQKCEVVERGDGWLLRDILLNNNPLREKVTFEPERRVLFERVGGDELGRIENVIGEDERGDLTLTFSFSLTKKGLEENSDAERQHFAPMEGAYMGAVASTLAAVRRTVDEQGREKLSQPSGIDTAGNTTWIYDFFRAADSLNLDRLSDQVTDDVLLTFANYPTSQGRAAFRGSIGGLWSRITGMSHSLSGVWSLHDDQVGIAEMTTMYTRPDATMYPTKICTILRRRDGKIADMRIHGDTTQL
jgi:hypothetical protein